MRSSQLKNCVTYDKLLLHEAFINNTDVMQRHKHARLTVSVCFAPDCHRECYGTLKHAVKVNCILLSKGAVPTAKNKDAQQI